MVEVNHNHHHIQVFSMFIQTEETPNPLVLKFLPGEVVMPSGTAEYKDVLEAQHSPLARKLFEIQGVTRLFLGHDFISVTKTEEKDWYFLKPFILGAIMEHFLSGDPVIQEKDAGGSHSYVAEDSEHAAVVKEIIELLDARVRPMVAQDGGDILFERFEQGIVYLRMQGACSGCPSSTATLKSGVENMLKHYIPEVLEVRSA